MEQIIDLTPATDTSKSRNAVIAFLLSLVLPGLGQIYNGQLKKGTFFFGILLLIPFLAGITRVTTFFYGLLFLILTEICLRIFIIADGVRTAKRLKEFVPGRYNTWYYHLLIAIVMVAVLWVYDTRSMLKTQTFNIPTTSNNPTFQVGDCLVADLNAYENSEPDYGDIVVYSRPDGKIYTFRVAGKPGDKLELKDNIITINGKPGKATFIKEATSDNFPVSEFVEEFPNGHKHSIYKFRQDYDSTKANIRDIIVPEDSYYLLGDNRDNALDSRYEGFISKDRIKGRIIYSYWGNTTDRINIDFRNK
jgi:signal peptidase I